MDPELLASRLAVTLTVAEWRAELRAAVREVLAPQRPPMSLPELAKLLGVSVRTLSRMVATGRLKTAKIGSRTVVPPDEVDRLMALQGDR